MKPIGNKAYLGSVTSTRNDVAARKATCCALFFFAKPFFHWSVGAEDIWNVEAPHVPKSAGTTAEERESFGKLLDSGFKDPGQSKR